MSKRLNTLEDIRNLKVDDKVTLIAKNGKVIEGVVEAQMSNRGYIDLNEIEILVEDFGSSIMVNVDKYLSDSGSLQDIILEQDL